MVKKPSPQDEAILDHVARYRLTLPQLLANSGILQGADSAGAQTALDALESDGLLAASPLTPGFGSSVFYHLTVRGAKAIGHDPEFARPLPRDLRIESFAIATYCCETPSRKLLTKAEFQEKFKALWFPGQPVRYCLERQRGGEGKLCFLKVDMDGAGRWDRLIDSCARFLRQRTSDEKTATENKAQVAAFTEVVRRGQFEFAVLTSLAEKKRAIELELERRTAAAESVPPMRVHVVPGLFDLLFPEIGSNRPHSE